MKYQTTFFLIMCFNISADAMSGNCNESDNQIFGHNGDFISQWRLCGESAFGDSSATIRCLEEHFPKLQSSCGQCFGEFTGCGATRCRSSCFWDSSSSRCTECGLKNCGPAWERCTGSSVDLIRE